MSKKIGRNDPCPCGSGRKYKKCCMNKKTTDKDDLELFESRLKAKQMQLIKQQGLGKQIISEIHKGKRYVAVGCGLYYNDEKKWQTFHDFLSDYIKMVLDRMWGANELTKPFEERHPLIQWMNIASDYLKKNKTGISVKACGSIAAINRLAYNLYLIAHNVELQEVLVKRLKNKDQFYGALYETQVAATLLLAGFTIKFENESDCTKTHCEFIATHPVSQEKYSVEVKRRNANKDNISIGNQLYKALCKSTDKKRIVFIEVNAPSLENDIWNIVKELKEKEKTLKIKGKMSPSAYLCITNHSYEYNLGDTTFEEMGLFYGFKIDDFGNIGDEVPLAKALDFREKHKDMEHLIKCLKEYTVVPATFDGEIPLFAFDEKAKEERLLIGNKYIVPNADGKEVIGTLTNAIVLENECIVSAIYQLEDGKQIRCNCPISNEELEAYRQHPDTFFCVPLETTKKTDTPLDLYDFFYNSHINTPKEKLLEFMGIEHDDVRYKEHSQKEVLRIYCERLVYSAASDKI